MLVIGNNTFHAFFSESTSKAIRYTFYGVPSECNLSNDYCLSNIASNCAWIKMNHASVSMKNFLEWNAR